MADHGERPGRIEWLFWLDFAVLADLLIQVTTPSMAKRRFLLVLFSLLFLEVYESHK